jgi:hypothetical protein
LVNSDTPARDQIKKVVGRFSQTIGAIAPRQVDALAPAVVPADFQPLALDVEQKNAFVAEYSRIHPESTAQEMPDVREFDMTEIGKANHRVG